MGPAALLLIPLAIPLLLLSPVLAPLALLLNAPWLDVSAITSSIADWLVGIGAGWLIGL